MWRTNRKMRPRESLKEIIIVGEVGEHYVLRGSVSKSEDRSTDEFDLVVVSKGGFRRKC